MIRVMEAGSSRLPAIQEMRKHTSQGGARHPKWVMDIVAMFLMSFHVSIGSYCRERCYLRNDRRGKKPRTSFPKTYYDALPFIVNNHAKTVDAIIQGR